MSSPSDADDAGSAFEPIPRDAPKAKLQRRLRLAAATHDEARFPCRRPLGRSARKGRRHLFETAWAFAGRKRLFRLREQPTSDLCIILLSACLAGWPDHPHRAVDQKQEE